MTEWAGVADCGDIPAGAALSLRTEGLLIYPTDTLYGIGVDPRSTEALARLLRVKGRDEGKPLPLLLESAGRVADWAASVPESAARLMARFWPGALTIVLPAVAGLPPGVTGGTDTVGLRVPAHPVARALAAALGGAITGTSANRAGEAGMWESAEALLSEFSGEADWLLWDGPVVSALPSTVAAVSASGVVVCIREGAIPFSDIIEYLQGRR